MADCDALQTCSMWRPMSSVPEICLTDLSELPMYYLCYRSAAVFLAVPCSFSLDQTVQSRQSDERGPNNASVMQHFSVQCGAAQRMILKVNTTLDLDFTNEMLISCRMHTQQCMKYTVQKSSGTVYQAAPSLNKCVRSHTKGIIPNQQTSLARAAQFTAPL